LRRETDDPKIILYVYLKMASCIFPYPHWNFLILRMQKMQMLTRMMSRPFLIKFSQLYVLLFC